MLRHFSDAPVHQRLEIDGLVRKHRRLWLAATWIGHSMTQPELTRTWELIGLHYDLTGERTFDGRHPVTVYAFERRGARRD